MSPRSGPQLDGSTVDTVERAGAVDDAAAGPARLPLSFAQEQLWFLDQLSPGETMYNVANVYRLRGELDVGVLRRCLTLVVERHDSLRASFGASDGVPYQVIAAPAEVELPVTDWAGAEPDLGAALGGWAGLPYDLERGPLYRFTLFRLAADDHVLGLGFHHIVTDGWSAGLMNAELSAAYQALVGGGEPALPRPELRYADHVRVEREGLSGPALAEELDYWAEHLADLPVLELPADRRRPVPPTYRGDSVTVDFPVDLLGRLRALATEQGTSLFMALTAALGAVLSRYTGQHDIALGVPMLGRSAPELERVVGLFVNMVVLRADLAGDPSYVELLERITDANFDLYDHQEVPFEKVVERVQPVRDPGRNPLFQVAVQVLGSENSGTNVVLPGVTVQPLSVRSSRARFDLAVNFVEAPDSLLLNIEFSTDLFDRWRVEALIGHLVEVLTAVLADPELRVSELPLLPAGERDRLLAAGSGEQVVHSQDPIHVDVARVAAAQPDAVAVVCRGRELSYAELDRRAGRLARHLRSLGLRPEQIVAIALDRDLDAIVAMLGVLKAGAAFTMIDPAHPAARLDYMLRDTAAPLVLTRSTVVSQLPEPAGWVPVLLDQEWGRLDPGPAGAADEPLAELATRDSLAYVLYTSGSTGKPKGVLIEHRALTCFVEAYRRTFDFGPGDRMLQLPALTFDMSQGEIFTGLTAGATLVLVSAEEGRSPDALASLMREQRVSYAGLSPVMLSLVEPEPYPDLRCVMGGADALPGELVNKWNLPGRRFVNLYGPTEAAVACTEYECEHVDWPSSPPIGHPELNRRVYVVDQHDNLVPVGVPGELLIGGDEGLARGYLNQPELTAEKFVADPFQPGGLVYRSGDLVRWTPELELDFLGRLDSQVKLRGLRIELGEIESALLAQPQVRMAVVTLHIDERGEKQLVGYLTAASEVPPAPADLRRQLSEQLPEYMVPTAWVVLPEFPLTAARKVDRGALPPPGRPAEDAGREYLAPTTPTQTTVAEIVAEVLGLPQVGVDANLFELGGNSLQAMRVVSRLKKALGVKINIRMLYGTSTVSAIAAKIDTLLAPTGR